MMASNRLKPAGYLRYGIGISALSVGPNQPDSDASPVKMLERDKLFDVT
jgi:hypothetical protein